MKPIVVPFAVVLGVYAVAALQSPATQNRPVTSSGMPRAAATVRDFGATGDGKTDDTAAIQQAVDSGIGNVRLPRGVYRLTRPVVVDLDRVGPVSISGEGTARLLMQGAGPALKIVGTHQGTAEPRTVSANVWQRQRMPLVDGIEIVGDHPEASGIELTGTMQATLTRVTVRSARHGIHLTQRNRNVQISDCHLYENDGVGLFLDGVNLHQINVVGCHISYNKQGGIVVRDSEVRNLQIGTCDIEGNMGPDGPPTANILLDTTHGSVREGAIVGCTIQHTHDAPGSANIRLLGQSSQQPHKVGNLVITGNALSDVAVNIHLKHARGVAITANTFWKGFEQNLLVEGSSNIVVGPNLFDRNPDYRPADSPNGLVFRDSADCTQTGLHVNNTVSAAAGIVLERCRWFNVTGCTLLDCDNGGILLRECQNCRIADCLIGQRRHTDRPAAVRIVGGTGNVVSDCLLRGQIELRQTEARLKDNEIID